MSKPVFKMVGANGNVFNLLGIATKAMRKAKESKEKIDRMQEEVFASGSYDEALQVFLKYGTVR